MVWDEQRVPSQGVDYGQLNAGLLHMLPGSVTDPLGKARTADPKEPPGETFTGSLAPLGEADARQALRGCALSQPAGPSFLLHRQQMEGERETDQ